MQDYIKPKSFCTAKETISKMETQPMGQEEISANHLSHKSLISKIYRKLHSLPSLLTKEVNGHFSKEDRHKAKSYMERYAMSVIIREMQIKTTMRVLAGSGSVGWSIISHTKRLWVRFPVTAHTQVVVQSLVRVCMKGNWSKFLSHRCLSLSLSLSLPPLSSLSQINNHILQ